MINVVLLDFDDTLCLSEEACFHLENDVAQGMGHAPMTREIHKKTWGKPTQDIINKRVPGINVKEFVIKMEKRMSEYVDNNKFDRIPERNLSILDSLRQKKKKVAILTSRSLSEAKHLLHSNHPLTKRIDAFYHRDNLDYLKPDPRVFNDALYQFDALPQECVYVGDSITDAQAAKKAGLHFIAVMESGLRSKNDFQNEHVDFFAEKFTDILPYILSH